MTIEQANQYFAALPEGFAPAEELRAALPAAAQQVAYVGVAGTADLFRGRRVKVRACTRT